MIVLSAEAAKQNPDVTVHLKSGHVIDCHIEQVSFDTGGDPRAPVLNGHEYPVKYLHARTREGRCVIDGSDISMLIFDET